MNLTLQEEYEETTPRDGDVHDKKPTPWFIIKICIVSMLNYIIVLLQSTHIKMEYERYYDPNKIKYLETVMFVGGREISMYW